MTKAPLIRKPELAKLTGLTVYKIERLTRARAIPFLKMGHRTVCYDLDDVRAALAKREVRPVGR